MKVPSAINTVETIGNIQRTPFSIAITSESFRNLSSGLYKYKVRAVIRELSTNAFDAHVMAGNLSQGFDVHLPNKYEPWFAIRDYGVGLSRDDIEGPDLERFDENTGASLGKSRKGGIYTTYFRSNKTDSDETHGCLGLGSKSPFCYTDSFNVVSYYNGKKYSYIAFINEKDFPDIAYTGEADTDEPNGLYVELPVKEADFKDFKREAEDVYQWFTSPINIGGDTIDIKNTKYADPSYTSPDGSYKLFNSGTIENLVVMGNVAYPLDLSAAGVSSRIVGRHKRVVIYAPIGAVKMITSREGLEYIDKTKDYVKQIIEAGDKVACQEIQDELTKQTCLYDAWKLCQENSIFFAANVTWNGIRLQGDITRTAQLSGDCERYRKNWNHRVEKEETLKHISIDYRDLPAIVINDLLRGQERRIRYNINNHLLRSKTIYLISDKEDVTKIVAELGIKDDVIRKLSELEKVPSNTSGEKRIDRIWEFTGNVRKQYEAWEAETNIPNGGVYVRLESMNFDIIKNKRPCDRYSLATLYRKIKKLEPNFKLYGLRSRVADKILSKGWIHVEDYYKKLVESRSRFISYAKHWDSWKSVKALTKLNFNNPEIKNLITKWNGIKSKEAKITSHSDLVNDMGDFGIKAVDGANPLKELKTIKTKYPLINYWIENGMPEKSLVEHYINLVEKRN